MAVGTKPRIHEVPDDLLAAIDWCYEQGLTDGLPVVPPVVPRVEAMLAADARPRAKPSDAWRRRPLPSRFYKQSCHNSARSLTLRASRTWPAVTSIKKN